MSTMFPFDDKLRQRIRETRLSLGLTYREAAKRSCGGITSGGICNIERGAIRNPGVFTVESIAKALGVHAAWLAWGVGDKWLDTEHQTK